MYTQVNVCILAFTETTALSDEEPALSIYSVHYAYVFMNIQISVQYVNFLTYSNHKPTNRKIMNFLITLFIIERYIRKYLFLFHATSAF